MSNAREEFDEPDEMEDCPNCGGTGYSDHDCGEDCCATESHAGLYMEASDRSNPSRGIPEDASLCAKHLRSAVAQLAP